MLFYNMTSTFHNLFSENNPGIIYHEVKNNLRHYAFKNRQIKITTRK
ncbi:hypothetical protein XBI1_1120016 [Xenorhabdus bovienii str. Intermedium]|uniref:Uncharacterized protein n=1 Tax=Xenorhabdus bovienii str. Intermedium TaxID=1379677 RepID=A0A077QCQ7_XENBV|nr:hypothetical protein XBI1_1120016 [Xenorhabdus bovienii str. Intermedium]